MTTSIKPTQPLKIPSNLTTRGNERCALLLKVATELFLKYGYRHTCLDQIVEQTGGSKASIYKYFGSKKGLFLYICQQRCDRFIHQIELVFNQPLENLNQQLHQLLYELFLIFSHDERDSFFILLLQTAQDNPDIAQELYDTGSRRVYDLFAKYLQQAHQHHLIYCENPRESALLLFGFFHDIHWRKMIGLPVLTADEDIHQKIAYFVEKFIAAHQFQSQ